MYMRSKCALKRVKVPNVAQAASRIFMMATVKERERLTTPSIYAQRLFIDSKYNVASSSKLSYRLI